MTPPHTGELLGTLKIALDELHRYQSSEWNVGRQQQVQACIADIETVLVRANAMDLAVCSPVVRETLAAKQPIRTRSAAELEANLAAAAPKLMLVAHALIVRLEPFDGHEAGWTHLLGIARAAVKKAEGQP